MLYAVGICLGMLASLFALWPILRKRLFREHGATVSHDQFMRDLYRDRVEELAVEAHDDDVRLAMRDERGAVLLAESNAPVESASQSPGTPPPGTESPSSESPSSESEGAESRGPLLAIALATLLAGYAVYWSSADIGQLDVVGAEDVLILSVDTHRAAIESWARRLELRVEGQTEDAKSWYLLGHARLKLGLHRPAAEAFATTHTLVADDLTVQM